MSIAQYLTKFALGVTNEGLLTPAKGGTGNTSGGGSTTPTITAVSYPGNDTAVNTAGGDTVTLTGTNFGVGASVIVNSIPASVVTRVSATQLTFTAPANAAGSYIIYVVNADGATALGVPGLQYSGVPAWSTAAGSLGSIAASTAASFTASATSNSAVTYSLYSGTLPSGLSLNSSTGAITGTAPSVGSTTTYNFTIRATDSENQDTDRNFSLTITAAMVVEYLVVAGGGAGAGDEWAGAGGGGAGGLLASTAPGVVSGVVFTCTVGAGATAVGQTSIGAGGSNSSLQTPAGTITAIGGGTAAAYSATTQGQRYGDGGSGGGAAWLRVAGLGVSGPPRQGYDGGTDSTSSHGGGGGGAGGGGASTNNFGGAGGSGVQWPAGSGTYYAGGGGGSTSTNGGVVSGGAGGGGSGRDYNAGSVFNGSTNTGGGGGGSWNRTNVSQGGTRYVAGNGGSGIVILRYLDVNPAAASTTGNPTVTVADGYRTYRFTNSGTITF